VKHLVETHDQIEDSSRFDPAFEDVQQQLLDVRADRVGSMTNQSLLLIASVLSSS